MAKHYPGATLTPANQTYDSVVQGVVDVGNIVLGYTMGKFPLSEVLDYPLGYPSGTVATHLVNEYFKKFKPKEFDDVKVMYFHAQTPGILHTRKRSTNWRTEGYEDPDIRFKCRVHETARRRTGAMTMGEAYDAINKGVADGLLCAYEALEGWKLGEVVKYDIENFGSAYTATFVVAMNKQKWASISPADQKIIEQINQEWIEKQAKVWDDIDASGKAFSQKRVIRLLSFLRRKMNDGRNKQCLSMQSICRI